MGRMMNGGSGGRQENKRWSLIHGPRLLEFLLMISMIHVAASQNKMNTLDQGLNKIRSPRYVKTAGKTNTQSSRVCYTKEFIEAAEQIKSSMNTSVDPCDDFHGYACGLWPKNNILPPGYTYYDVLNKIYLKTEEYKKSILENGTIEVNGMSREVKDMPSDLYKSCINLTAIENLGDAPLRERIVELGGWNMIGNWNEDMWDFEKTLLSIHKAAYGGPVFSVAIVPDGKDITKKSLSIDQAGPALGKEEYLNLSSKEILAYKQLIIDVVVLLGGDANTTAKKADEIIDFEAKLANVSQTVAEIQESLSINVTLEQLQQEVPEFHWNDYLNSMIAPSSSTMNKTELIFVPSLSYLKKAMKIVQNTSKSVLANYMIWYVIRTEVKWLSAPFRNATFKYNQVTVGTTSEQERWKKCVGEVDGSFSDVIAVAYVNEYHTRFTRPISMAKEMFNDTIQAFKENVISSVTWLDNATKRAVLEKADAMGIFVGFPDYMLNSTKIAKLFEKYRGQTIEIQTYFKNKISIFKHSQHRMLADFRKPLDNSIWFMSPLDGNAAYDLSLNIVSIPAAILQPPIFFPDELLRAYSLGSFGSVIAHEVMHGFGKLGRSFDKDGKTRNWWSKKSVQEFYKRVDCYETQFSAYKILGKWPINGKDTAEENVADDGSLKIALKLYYDWADRHATGFDTWRLPGLNFTNEQLFYIGFAQTFCSSATLETRHFNSLDASHADEKFRIIGTLANSCEFANAFKCKINSPMNPVKKCYLWSKEGPLF
ncbi:endothelin-converting enzyme 1-like [Actinia tenebrosa]|uniref:Endothelin-converting enzyme 1-like n=1 Tax=Actinia tenebrosa TaxID=6105 RepID=A0A6P8IE76_ACTTE|nr:endothelin-converting enzyme 1-like [Actinia tenebrosa]